MTVKEMNKLIIQVMDMDPLLGDFKQSFIINNEQKSYTFTFPNECIAHKFIIALNSEHTDDQLLGKGWKILYETYD